MKLFETTTFFLLVFVFISTAGSASVTVTLEAPRVVNSTATFAYVGSETFDSRSSGNFESDFGWGPNSPIKGSYTGVNILPADRNGGAGQSGKYNQVWPGKPLKLTFSQLGSRGINYFGLWTSALDPLDRINFYYQGRNFFNWTAPEALEKIGGVGYGGYRGNTAYNGWGNYNPDWVFAFINFFFTDMQIDQVEIWQERAAAFEQDNHTVGFFTQQSGLYPMVKSCCCCNS